MTAPLLVEIGCEEIPARMIASAAADLAARVVAVLDAAGVTHGAARHWGGTRRLAVRVDSVLGRLEDREETVLGPPAAAAFGPDGRPTGAGAGFAKKQGVAPDALVRIETAKGAYAGFTRTVAGRSLEQVLDAGLAASVAAMSFPKTMRWGTGEHRWVRPVHWLVALHGAAVLDLTILGARAGRTSQGHRFLAPGGVELASADAYVDRLAAARVLVDPVARRTALETALHAAAAAAGGRLVEDPALLEEITDLVEWPGVVVGRFDAAFLDLPRAILVTTLRHHQKSFSVQSGDRLLPAFLSVANTDRDPAGHVRRGNEWVVIGRLDDARFFWIEDRKRPLADRMSDLARVTFHKKLGSYAEKAERIAKYANMLADLINLDQRERNAAIEAGRLAKADLVTSLVGEFPELQGTIGGLLLGAEGGDRAAAEAISDHYKPVGAEDSLPASEVSCVVAVADRLDTIAGLIGAGETPTGSRDPFGLRRSASGVFRILSERNWPLSIESLYGASGQSQTVYLFLRERLALWLIDQGFTSLEVEAVQKNRTGATDFDTWSISEILARLSFLKTIRGNANFARLVELTKRVDNICGQVRAVILGGSGFEPGAYSEPDASVLALSEFHERMSTRIQAASRAHDFGTVVSSLSTYVEPIAAVFDNALVLDRDNMTATYHRYDLLDKVRTTLTADFDIRELAGQADTKR